MSLSFLPYWCYLMSFCGITWRHSGTPHDHCVLEVNPCTKFGANTSNDLAVRALTNWQTDRQKDTEKHGTDSITSTADAGGKKAMAISNGLNRCSNALQVFWGLHDLSSGKKLTGKQKKFTWGHTGIVDTNLTSFTCNGEAPFFFRSQLGKLM